MTSRFGLTVLEKASRWTYGTEQDIAKYDFPNFSIWTYDWANEDDVPGSGGHIDPDNEIDWEIELVQRWMKGENLVLSDLVETCDLVGIRDYMEGVDFLPREEAVIHGRYGIQNGRELTWGELAEQFGVTPERIKEIAAETLYKLIPSDESLANVCTRTSGKTKKEFDLEQLRGIASEFWTTEITHYQFTQRGLTLDTLCYLSFLYILSEYFNMEDPGILEVPERSLEVASNIDLLLGTLSRRMISSDSHSGFNKSSEFNLENQSWAVLTERAFDADRRLKKLLDEKINILQELKTWDDSSLVDCYAISLQISELFDSHEAQIYGGLAYFPLYYFLSEEQRAFGKLKVHIEAEMSDR